MDRELQLRVTGNYFKSLLKTVRVPQCRGLILRVALPQVADTLACTHEWSHTHTHRWACTRAHVDPEDMGTGCRQGADAQGGPT